MPKRQNDLLAKPLILINKNIKNAFTHASLWTLHQNEDAIMTIIVTLLKHAG
jgi:hypothetical protein